MNDTQDSKAVENPSSKSAKRKRGRPKGAHDTSIFLDTGKILICLPEDMRENFESLCRDNGLPRSSCARLAIAGLLKRVKENGGSII